MPAVARFIKDVALQSGRFRIKLISLATSSKDADSVLVSKPSTWLRGPRASEGIWDGLSFLHIGAMASEFEFQRYKPRLALTRSIADCDLLQVVCGTPAWAISVCGLGKPVAVQCATRARVERRQRDAQAQGFGGWWRKGMTAVTDRLDDRALRLADAVQVENPWMLEYATRVNGVRQLDLRYAPPGVDADLFAPPMRRGHFGSPYILCVARLSDPRKNIGLLLEAYAKLPLALIETTSLVLAGSSGPPASFWSRADQLGLRARVRYVARPARSDLVSLYQHAAAFVLPSDEEGLGVVLLEAMACGVPAVATRCGGPDGIITDGRDGYLVGLDDSQEMANRLSQLLIDKTLNLRMGNAARDTIEKRYAQGVTGAVFLDMWEQLLFKSRTTARGISTGHFCG